MSEKELVFRTDKEISRLQKGEGDNFRKYAGARELNIFYIFFFRIGLAIWSFVI